MIRGGVPERSLIAVIGSVGTGKTTVGLQFLDRALRNDEKAIFIALEESREAVLATAEEKGWEFEAHCEGVGSRPSTSIRSRWRRASPVFAANFPG